MQPHLPHFFRMYCFSDLGRFLRNRVLFCKLENVSQLLTLPLTCCFFRDACRVRRYPQFAEARPLVVTLEPGDVLYVPNHWWHFVEAVETSMSVNVWLEAPSDPEDRCSESVARVLMTSLAGELDAEASTCGELLYCLLGRRAGGGRFSVVDSARKSPFRCVRLGTDLSDKEVLSFQL